MNTMHLRVTLLTVFFLVVGFVVAPNALSSVTHEAYFTRLEDNGGQSDLVLENLFIDLLNSAPAGSSVRICMASWTRTAPANAVINAHNRGVDIRVIVALPGVSVLNTLSSLPTGRLAHHPNGSIGNNNNHNKFMTLSSLNGGSQKVVLQSSANLTNPQLVSENNSVVIGGDAALYDAFVDYWDDLWQNETNLDYYHVKAFSQGGRVHFSPRNAANGTTGHLDPVCEVLEDLARELGFFPYVSGSSFYLLGQGNPDAINSVRIRVAMSIWSEYRQGIARRLAALYGAGCDVKVISDQTTTDSIIWDILNASSVPVFRSNTVHSKNMMFEYTVGGVRTTSVLTGSHNYSSPALRYNDEVLIQINDLGMYDAYMDDWNRIANAIGDGSSVENPWKIYSIAQLLAVNENLSAHYVLMNDIDLHGMTFDGAVIAPDGDFPFTGVFDGNGHSIKRLAITNTGELTGLFGAVEGGTIVNLGVEDVNMQGQYRTGGLAGNVQASSTITGCFTTGVVSSTHALGRVGGLVGDFLHSSMSDSYSTANVSGVERVGGIIGHCSTGTLVQHCYATGTVTATEGAAGGLIGRPYRMAMIADSYATGNVTSGGLRIGGLVGWNTTTNIANCYATGDVTGGDRVGGLFGQLLDNSEIVDCYAGGSATGGEEVGGLGGRISGDNTVHRSYSTGAVSGDTHVGGIIGLVYGQLSDSFWDMETSGMTSGIANDAADTGAAGLMTAAMTTSAPFVSAGWNFSSTWFNCEGFSYPRLSWQEFAYSADINLDNRVDGADLRLLAEVWLEPAAGLCVDIVPNGVVDLEDFAALGSQWLSQDCLE